MTTKRWFQKRKCSRPLLTAVVFACVMSLYRKYVLPLSPDLDAQPASALVAGAVGALSWLIVSRVCKS